MPETNRKELYSLIKEYKDDEQHLRALYFLIENMDQHGFSQAALKDSSGNVIAYDASDYSDYDEAKAALEKMEEKSGELNFRLKENFSDNQEITASLLRENIEEAFAVWEKYPWCREYSEDDFFNYILPYRGSGEPLAAFRKTFREHFSDILENPEMKDVISLAAAINDRIKGEFKFNPKYYLHPTDQSLPQMMASEEGRCEDMTNYSIYAMRACGIAVTSDYTPHWADSNNNHAWNAVITPAGEAIPFMGCESNPGQYNLRQRIAKVYRKMYAVQDKSLGKLLKDNETAPEWLRSKSYIDVTKDYVNTAEVTIESQDTFGDSIRFMYLAVYNSGEWQAIAWSRYEDSKAVFKDMGTDLIYLPAFYIKGNLEPAADVFLLNDTGEIAYMNGDIDKVDMVLRSTTRMKQINLSEESDMIRLKNDILYKLEYWDENWQEVNSQVFTGKPLVIKDVPAGRLYRLLEENLGDEERIFIYIDDNQIWY